MVRHSSLTECSNKVAQTGWWAGEKIERERSDPGEPGATTEVVSRYWLTLGVGHGAVRPDRLGVTPDLQEAGEQLGGAGGAEEQPGHLGQT